MFVIISPPLYCIPILYNVNSVFRIAEQAIYHAGILFPSDFPVFVLFLAFLKLPAAHPQPSYIIVNNMCRHILTGQEELKFRTWPGEEGQEEVTTKGLWGPNHDERNELLLNSAKDASDRLSWPMRDGGDPEAVFGLEGNNGIDKNWDRLVLEMYESEYFSFSFEL